MCFVKHGNYLINVSSGQAVSWELALITEDGLICFVWGGVDDLSPVDDKIPLHFTRLGDTAREIGCHRAMYMILQLFGNVHFGIRHLCNKYMVDDMMN